jgi:diacylglycerol kinase (ATP)
MDKCKVCIIFNPGAKGGKALLQEAELRDLAGKAPILTGTEADTIQESAAAAVQNGYDHIIAAGGDGTVNAVVNGIAGADVTLSVLPMGTMNVFAYELGIRSNQLRKSWEMLQAGEPKTIDLARANQRYFIQLAGVGLDALTVQETNSLMRKTIGPVSYVFAAAQVIGRPAPMIRLQFADSSESSGCFVLIGNGRFYGGPIALFREAKNDDGLLDVLVFKHQSYLDIFRYLQGILIGNHIEMPDIECWQTPSLQILSDRAVPVELDGDVAGSTPLEFRIAREQLRVMAVTD